MAVTAANVKASAKCAEPVEVAFIEHRAPFDARAGLAANSLSSSKLQTTTLAPGEAATVRVRGSERGTLETVQAAFQTKRGKIGVDPCVAIAGSVFRSTGQVETIGGAQSADDFSILRPNAEATCIGSSSCDDLISLCEQQGDECSFTCHIAVPGSGQACVFGSTD